MKNSISVILFLLPFALIAQVLNQIDFVAPLEDGYAAVKKGDKWGFLNAEGEMAVSFRSDLVANNKVTDKVDLGIGSQLYPVMWEDRCIVKAIKDGIPYYGFINSSGKVVIEPQYLNVSNFKNGYALALKLEETVLGQSGPLGKRVVSYRYDVVLINPDGLVTKYLAGPFPIALSAAKLKVAPPIVAKDISENLISVRMPDNKWQIFKID